MRERRLVQLVALASLLAGCYGAATAPTGVSSSSATLNATVACDANTTTNPCQGYFEYWADGQQASPQKVPASPVVANSAYKNVTFSETASGLTPGGLYHYELCGQGDQNITSPACVGPNWNHGTNAPGSVPTAIDATSNFRTANPGANPPTQATIDYGRVTSSGETSNGVLYARDGGQSVQFSTSPAESLWVFGDTPITKSGSLVGFITGATAAIATYTAGQPSVSLAEVQSPLGGTRSSGASQFLGPAAALPNCTVANLQSEFPSAGITSSGVNRYDYTVAKEPASSKVALTFADVCLGLSAAGLAEWITEDEGIAEYDPVNNVFTTPPTILSGGGFDLRGASLPTGLPARLGFGNAVFNSDGELYLYSVAGGNPSSSPASAYLARIDPAHWTSGAAYRWCVALSGGSCTSWSSQSASAVPVATVNYYGGAETTLADFSSQPAVCSSTATTCYVMLSQAFGYFQVLFSTTPWGPWTAGPAGQVPDSCNAGQFGCYSVVAKPELSTASQLVYSWFSSDDGHVRLGTMSWSTPL